MADPLPRNSRADENAENIERALQRHDAPRPMHPFGAPMNGYHGLGRPAGGPAPQPNPFNAAQRAVPPNPFGAPRPVDPERQQRINNAAPLPLNSRAAPPAMPPRPAAAVPPARLPIGQPRHPEPARNQEWQAYHWVALIIGVVIYMLFNNGDARTSNNSYVPPSSPGVGQLITATPTSDATARPVTGAEATLTTITLTTTEPIHTLTPELGNCDVNALVTTLTINPTIVEGGGLIFRVDFLSEYCVGIPLRIGVWLERVNGERFLVPGADRLYSLATGQITLQAAITPTEQSGRGFAEFVLPLTQLSLPPGTYILDGRADARRWDTNVPLFDHNFVPFTLTLP